MTYTKQDYERFAACGMQTDGTNWIAVKPVAVWLGNPKDKVYFETSNPYLLLAILDEKFAGNHPELIELFPESYTKTWPKENGNLGVSFRGKIAYEAGRERDRLGNKWNVKRFIGAFTQLESVPRIWPNDVCPSCDSGKKWKKCCGRFL